MIREPRVGLFVVLAGLPFLGLLRRLLIPDAPWTSKDPLLLVVPVVIGFLTLQLVIVERRRVLSDLLPRLCALLGVIAVADVFNPSGGGITVGLGGLLFFVVPLLWFFAGWELADDRMIEAIMYTTILIALANAAYGLVQVGIGLPAWDKEWLAAVGPNLVSVPGTVGSAIRPIGSLSSPQEFIALLAIGIVFSLALARRHPGLVLTVPFLGVALFYGSGRSQLVLVVLAVAIMTALAMLRGRAVVIAIATAVAVTTAALVVLGPVLSQAAATSSNPLVEHQASGLANPFDQSDSTLQTHFSAFGQGVEDGITHPLGLGTGVSTIAADTIGNGGGRTQVSLDGSVESIRGTDTDISNTFESLGVVGGVVYLAILAIIAVRLLRRYSRLRDPLTLAVIGLMVVMTLQWLRGGLYAVSALTWFMAGWVTRPSSRQLE
jgi:hypothetical protein